MGQLLIWSAVCSLPHSQAAEEAKYLIKKIKNYIQLNQNEKLISIDKRSGDNLILISLLNIGKMEYYIIFDYSLQSDISSTNY